MKSLKPFLFVVCAAALFISCKSAKSLQSELRFLRFDLDYELTSNIHSGERNKTLYLNEIDNSNMEYFTSVPKAGSLVLPFILLNYWQKKYTVVLGEASLTQAYCEFLSDA
ncbi:MAG: hypothetical protein LBV57_06010, partial [Candidatus Symbiothrix sp.]|nr:hypothetical protein [Candidatus Symbiothrix sp.]